MLTSLLGSNALFTLLALLFGIYCFKRLKKLDNLLTSVEARRLFATHVTPLTELVRAQETGMQNPNFSFATLGGKPPRMTSFGVASETDFSARRPCSPSSGARPKFQKPAKEYFSMESIDLGDPETEDRKFSPIDPVQSSKKKSRLSSIKSRTRSSLARWASFKTK